MLGTAWITLWLEMLKDKATPSFVCIPVCTSWPVACVLPLYRVFAAHLLTAVHSAVPSFAARIWVSTGLLVAGMVGRGVFPWNISANLKRGQTT